jgi:hypothetical protein
LQHLWQTTSVSLQPSQQNGIQNNPVVIINKHIHHAKVMHPAFLLNKLLVYWSQYGQWDKFPIWAMFVIVADGLFYITIIFGPCIGGGGIIGGGAI